MIVQWYNNTNSVRVDTIQHAQRINGNNWLRYGLYLQGISQRCVIIKLERELDSP